MATLMLAYVAAHAGSAWTILASVALGAAAFLVGRSLSRSALQAKLVRTALWTGIALAFTAFALFPLYPPLVYLGYAWGGLLCVWFIYEPFRAEFLIDRETRLRKAAIRG
jgi:hypothetical protein